MPIYQLENIPQEFFTAQHSTAYGRLITANLMTESIVTRGKTKSDPVRCCYTW
jgi:hypothetical protein